MKIPAQVLTYFFLWFAAGLFLFACTDEPEVDLKNESPVDTPTVEDLDNFSDHLQFFSANKKQGNAPETPGGSSLRISIKDTLYLVGGVEFPIKFLHQDTTNNVAGAYVEVISMVGAGGTATYFYDVPEIPEVAPSDTVSAIGFGFNVSDYINSGGVLPAGAPTHTFDVTITPYDETGQPLDQTTIPVVIDNAGDSNDVGSSSCPLVLPEGEHWKWFATLTINEPDKFQAPESRTGGQYINGCCTDGHSNYSTTCAPPYVRLYFNTYYQAAYESIIFKDDGTYSRVTREEYANAAPDKSNFCGSGEGEIEERTFIQYTEGNWAIERNVSTPQSLRDFRKDFDIEDYLRLTPTSVTPSGGFIKTRGGFIWQNPCPLAHERSSPGVLGLIIPSGGPDGGVSQLVIKFFQRSKLAGSNEDEWFAFL